MVTEIPYKDQPCYKSFMRCSTETTIHEADNTEDCLGQLILLFLRTQ